MILPAIPHSLTVVVSRGQSRYPEKRAIEAAIVEAAGAIAGVKILDVPHLYDLKADSEVIAALRDTESELVVTSWLFPRATHWLLDRLGIRGQVGMTSFDEADDDDQEEPGASADSETRVIELFPRQDRMIYCLDMRAGDGDRLVSEIRRLALQAAQRDEADLMAGDSQANGRPDSLLRFDDASTRRWYPVIDYSRCTNCMECIDFCLFGVYGIDGAETILVEQPDNCRKGCPACSRVCPAGAIIFPQHKAPAIAGAAVEGDEGFKIDLSLLFGAPDKTADPIAVAARERDEQLLLAGRAAAGMPELRSRSQPQQTPPDQLDDLIDQLDRCEL
jgi:NAD-dependent dihydropyrimidine dehydrogenase PreA subunit